MRKRKKKESFSFFFLASGNIGETRFPKRCKNSETIFCHFWSAARKAKKKKNAPSLRSCYLSVDCGGDGKKAVEPDMMRLLAKLVHFRIPPSCFFSPFVMARFQVPIFRVSEPLLLSLCLFSSLNVGIDRKKKKKSMSTKWKSTDRTKSMNSVIQIDR